VEFSRGFFVLAIEPIISYLANLPIHYAIPVCRDFFSCLVNHKAISELQLLILAAGARDYYLFHYRNSPLYFFY
jgi:hypothetical protein